MVVSSFLETPMKGHKPKNFDNTKLLTKMVLINMMKVSVIN